MMQQARSSATSDPGSPVSEEIEDGARELMRLIARLIRHTKVGMNRTRDMSDLLQNAELGPRHMAPMLALATTGPLPVGELADALGLSPATVSQLVNELDRAGIFERRQDEGDRRRTIVSLREPHRSTIERCATAQLAPLRDTLEALTPAARECFLRGFQVMIETHDRAEAGGSGA